MPYYPMMANLAGKPCVVVGGGAVAERKIETLLQAGAKIKVISPLQTEKIRQWQEQNQLELYSRPFQPGDVHGAALVIAATDEPAVNMQVYESLEPYQWINMVDRPDLCTFIVPAMVQRGDLQIAISSGGKNPGLAKKLKQQIERWLGPEYEDYLEFLGQMRHAVLALPISQQEKRRLLDRLLDDRFFIWTKEKQYDRRNQEAQALLDAFQDNS